MIIFPELEQLQSLLDVCSSGVNKHFHAAVKLEATLILVWYNSSVYFKPRGKHTLAHRHTQIKFTLVTVLRFM